MEALETDSSVSGDVPLGALITECFAAATAYTQGHGLGHYSSAFACVTMFSESGLGMKHAICFDGFGRWDRSCGARAGAIIWCL